MTLCNYYTFKYLHVVYTTIYILINIRIWVLYITVANLHKEHGVFVLPLVRGALLHRRRHRVHVA